MGAVYCCVLLYIVVHRCVSLCIAVYHRELLYREYLLFYYCFCSSRMFPDLPHEILVSCLQPLDHKDLGCLLDVFPQLKSLIIYTKYSHKSLKTSEILPEDLSYLHQHDLTIHPHHIIINSIHPYHFRLLQTSANITLDISSFEDSYQFYKPMLIRDQIAVNIITNHNQQDLSQLNVNQLKINKIPNNFRIDDHIHHLDLSFIGLDDLTLLKFIFPQRLKSLNLSNNRFQRIDNHTLRITHLCELSVLDISNNDIFYFDLKLNCSLKLLNLASNLIFNPSFIMNGLSAYLEWLNLSYNLISSQVPCSHRVNRIELNGNYI